MAARAVQGLGGAVVSAVGLSLIMTMFTEPAERARAMGVYGFVCAGGGSVGVLLGGVLTTLLDWRWIFLVNLPIGVVVALLCRALIAPGGRVGRHALDWAGAHFVDEGPQRAWRWRAKRRGPAMCGSAVARR